MGDEIQFRTPEARDAAAIWQMVHDEGGLDLNSPYAYLLLCTDFASTSLVAFDDRGLVGFLAGYRPPESPEAIFVWQVGVAKRARRKGLASRLIHGLLGQPGVKGVDYVTATVTPDNAASMALFERLAAALEVPIDKQERFGTDLFPATQPGFVAMEDGSTESDDASQGVHQPELQLTVGPLSSSPSHKEVLS